MISIANITLALPDELHKKMKKHTEIRWSEVVRKSISNKIEELEMVKKIAKKSRLTRSDVEDLARMIDKKSARKMGLL
ncbi:MAG: hypothetical protein ACMXYL_05305 [Candidatus Woesearchaeota archaeon]